MHESWFTSDKSPSVSKYSVIIKIDRRMKARVKVKRKIKGPKIRNTTRIREITSI